MAPCASVFVPTWTLKTKDLHKEVIIRSPKKVGSFRVQGSPKPFLLYGFLRSKAEFGAFVAQRPEAKRGQEDKHEDDAGFVDDREDDDEDVLIIIFKIFVNMAVANDTFTPSSRPVQLSSL